MWQILVMICLGILVGTLIHFCFRLLRQSQPIWVIILGWLVTAFGIFCCISLGPSYFATRDAPQGPMGPIWGALLLEIVILILLSCGIGLLHRGLYGMTWLTAYAMMMTEIVVTDFVLLVWNGTTYHLASLLRGGSHDTGRILASYDQAYSLQSDFALALVSGLVLLERVRHFGRFSGVSCICLTANLVYV